MEDPQSAGRGDGVSAAGALLVTMVFAAPQMILDTDPRDSSSPYSSYSTALCPIRYVPTITAHPTAETTASEHATLTPTNLFEQLWDVIASIGQTDWLRLVAGFRVHSRSLCAVVVAWVPISTPWCFAARRMLRPHGGS
jgi:hypothetical protein